jgi:putative flavoprotein involved in K+ transport
MRTGGVELVGAVEAFQGSEVLLADGTHITPDVVIAATGYRPGLEELVGHRLC